MRRVDVWGARAHLVALERVQQLPIVGIKHQHAAAHGRHQLGAVCRGHGGVERTQVAGLGRVRCSGGLHALPRRAARVAAPSSEAPAALRRAPGLKHRS